MVSDPAELGSQELEVVRISGTGVTEAARDWVAVEAPLEILVDGKPGAVVMRTPGDDVELITGFLFTEGVIASAVELRHLTQSRPGGDSYSAFLSSRVAGAALPERSLVSSSSCGVCGKTSLAALEVSAPPVLSALTVSPATLLTLPGAMRAAQPLFSQTGGLHAAAVCTAAGELLCVREDVGRHNAVDKVIGWGLLQDPEPFAESVLQVSGRVSYEIVQKAIVAGFPVVSAVSAPSSLAVELAQEYGVTLCAFVRDGRFAVYSHAHRIAVA